MLTQQNTKNLTLKEAAKVLESDEHSVAHACFREVDPLPHSRLANSHFRFDESAVLEWKRRQEYTGQDEGFEVRYRYLEGIRTVKGFSIGIDEDYEHSFVGDVSVPEVSLRIRGDLTLEEAERLIWEILDRAKEAGLGTSKAIPLEEVLASDEPATLCLTA